MQTLIANPTLHTMVFMVLAAIIINMILSPLARIAGRKHRARIAAKKQTPRRATKAQAQAHRPVVIHVHIHTEKGVYTK